jgi:bifunctional DNA-binding transcriptional regulator/antitoxin component of YhaV-PrlF toxin-antitoxin module
LRLPIAENVKNGTGRSRISAKRQVTIPAAAFHGAGFQAGDVVRVEAQGAGRVVLTKVAELVDRDSGSLATRGELGRSIQTLRDEW